jgi:hypothetical protein
MKEVKSNEIYGVCAVSRDRWDVYQDLPSHPVASFQDKASALNYAMCLARGRVAWHLLLRSGEGLPGNAAALLNASGARPSH